MINVIEKIQQKFSKEFEKYDLNENLEITLSKIENYDLQINNLVKHNKKEFFNNLKSSCEKILIDSDYFLDIVLNEQGFINFNLNHEKLIKEVPNTSESIYKDKNIKIIFDYGGPNIGKPLHVGHMRTLNIGRSLYNTHSFVGYQTISDIHLGDWGMPIAQIITYMEKNNIELNNLDVEKLQIIYPKASEEYKKENQFKIRAQEVNKLLNENDKFLINMWKSIKEISIRSLEENFEILNHRFDYWLGESDVNDLIPNMIDSLLKDGKLIYDDGALISKQESDPKILITKSDGSYLYITTDLATILYRQSKFNYDKSYYIVDNRQSLHFKQLFDSIKFFSFNNLEHEHINYGTLNDSDGNPFKTRDGGTKPLSELFDETYNYLKRINKKLDDETLKNLTNSVLTYSDLLSNRKTDYKFDLEKFTNINGKTGIYVQYAQVRAKKIRSSFLDINQEISKLILSEIDKKLLSKLFLFTYYLEQTIKLKEPHHLANYLYEISNLFNQFYEDENLSNIKNSNHLASKIYLVDLFLTTSHNVMYCLGLVPVKQM
jgi:arginyl-tRNA synthetase